mgnify:CR=1 FL=1
MPSVVQSPSVTLICPDLVFPLTVISASGVLDELLFITTLSTHSALYPGNIPNVYISKGQKYTVVSLVLSQPYSLAAYIPLISSLSKSKGA